MTVHDPIAVPLDPVGVPEPGEVTKLPPEKATPTYAEAPEAWRCSNCGTVRWGDLLASLDPRYAHGRCSGCKKKVVFVLGEV